MFRIFVSLLLPMVMASSAAAEFQQQGTKLLGTAAVGNSFQANSVAVSADGNTAIVGGPGDNVSVGAVWIFTRSGGTWTQQGSKLVGTGAAGTAQQGSSVAVSADGNTAVVGGYGDNASVGAVWIFTRSGSTWTQQGAKLVGTGATGTAQQGISVAVSSDGNTAVVGGHGDNSSVGAVWIFTRSGGVWTQQGSKLVGTGAAGASTQGRSVAVSADGNTVIAGGSNDNAAKGAVWVFTRSGGVWSQQGSKLVASSTAGGSNQGVSVSMSADGNTAAVGADGEGPTGAVWIFTRSGGTWSQQASRLVGTDGVGAHQGSAVAMSADASTLVVGGYADNGSIGAVWIFTRSGGTWTQQGSKLVGTGATASGAMQGYAVAMSADGNTVISGGYADNSSVGATWVFVNPAPRIVSVTDVANDQGGKVHVLWNASVFDVAPSYGISSYTLWRRITTATAAEAVTQGAPLVRDGSGGRGAIRMTTEAAQSVFWEFVQSVPARGVSGYGYMAPTTSDSLPGSISAPQGPRLVGSGAAGNANQGISSAVSGDGNTLIVGGPADNGSVGAVWIFTRSGSTWSQQGSKLVGTGASGAAQQGWSVALSSDGNTALVGGKADAGGHGAVWIFTRSGGVWTQQGSKLVGAGATGTTPQQGYSVALSADGGTAVVGGNGDNANLGAVWVFTRSGSTWNMQAKLVGTNASTDAGQGVSVAASADGNTVLVGGNGDAFSVGAVWVFTRSGTTWTQQGAKLVGTGAVGAAFQGIAVALSSDGNTALVGGDIDDTSIGAVWVFTRSGGTWTQQGSKLVGTGAANPARQGVAVDLSSDGNTAIVGADFDNSHLGAVWIFTRSGGTWTQQGSKLTIADAAGLPQLGTAVSISADAKTAVLSAPYDNFGVGAAYVYTPAVPWNVFFVDAKEATSSTFYVSPADSGYSVDNLPPGPPAGTAAAYISGATNLHWSSNLEGDFSVYRVYRGNSADFVPGPGNLVATKPDTGYADVGPAGSYYKISAVDEHGNESAFAVITPAQTLGTPSPGPLAFALERVRPNPASVRNLTVVFTLTTRTAARLELLDVAGRIVASREVGALGPGSHAVNLAEHTRLRPGLLFIRLTQGTNERVTRVTVLE